MATPPPGVPGVGVPIGAVVSLESIYALSLSTHEKVGPLADLAASLATRVTDQDKRLRSLENWRLALVTLSTVSMGTAAVNLFQLPLLNK